MQKIKILSLALLLFFIPSLQAQKTIAIFTHLTQDLKPWDPDSVKSGIAGSEEAVIYMSAQLSKLGYKVTVFGTPPKGSPYSLESANPRFVSSDFESTEIFDIGISWRKAELGEALSKRAQKVFFWPHDTCREVFSEKQIGAFDGVLWLSEWQRKQWISINPSFAKFTEIFGNGINPEQFLPVSERKNPYSCIYGSNYGRGLEHLLDIWPEIKEEFPKATLDIYYGWQHWGVLTPEKERKLRKQVKDLEKLDVKEHGMVSHERLTQAFEEASLWTYPCPPTEVETFCITAIRAQLAGSIPVIVRHSALYETTRFGFACEDQKEYLDTLRKAMQTISTISLTDRKEIGQFVLNQYTWEKLALRWKDLFEKPSLKKTVCLAMMTQNSASTLKSCLESVKDKINSWVILDAGSTDGSEDIVWECLKNIPGEFIQENSEMNSVPLLNELLSKAKSKADYLLLVEPHETLVFADDISLASLTHDSYHSFLNPLKERLIRSSLNWKWSGVFDKQLICLEATEFALLPGFISSEEVRDLADPALLSFYLAQSYLQSGKYQEAHRYHQKVIESKDSQFPTWSSFYHIGLLNELLGKESKVITEGYLSAYAQDPFKAEPLFRLAVYYLSKQENEKGYEIAKQALAIQKPIDTLPQDSWIYDHGIPYVLANCAFNKGMYEEAISLYELALSRNSLSNPLEAEIRENLAKALLLKGK